jgi:hypothetical protein
MAGSNKYSYYSNSALQTTTFSQDQPVNTDWFDEVTRTGAYTQNNISVSGSTENIVVFFSVGNYEEKAVLNGLDYSRTTFRNNNEYKISKKLTLNQNFSFGITKSNPKPLSFLRMLSNHLLFLFVFNWTICHLLETMVLQGQQDLF